MSIRRFIIVGLAGAILGAAVTIAVMTAGRPEPACACTVEPDLRGPAEDAAARFEALVRRSDVSGAWALLTDEARSRYVDVAGFRPVLDRLGRALRGTDADSGWRTVDDHVRYDVPSEAVVVRRWTGPPRPVRPLLIRVPLGHAGDERIDPEVPPLRLTARRDGDGVRVQVPGADLELTSFVLIDGAGQDASPSRQHVTEGVDRLTWSGPLRGPVLVIAIERSGTGLRVGSGVAPRA